MTEAAEQDKCKEQDNSYRDTGISYIEDSKVVVDFRNTKGDKIRYYAAIMGSIEQVAKRTANNHAKDDFVEERACIDHAYIEVSHNTDRCCNEHHKHSIIRENAKRRSPVLNVVKNQVRTDYRDSVSASWRSHMRHHQGLCPLIKQNDHKYSEQCYSIINTRTPGCHDLFILLSQQSLEYRYCTTARFSCHLRQVLTGLNLLLSIIISHSVSRREVIRTSCHKHNNGSLLMRT